MKIPKRKFSFTVSVPKKLNNVSSTVTCGSANQSLWTAGISLVELMVDERFLSSTRSEEI